MHYLELLVLVIVLIACIVAAILVAAATNKITKIRGYENNDRLISARSWYDWASIALWFGSILAALITVIFLIQASYSDTHRHNFATHGFVRGVIWILLVMLFVAGIFLFVGYNEMRNSTVYTQRTDPDSTINTYLVTSMIIIGSSILLVLLIVFTTLFRKPRLHEEEREYLAEELQKDVENNTHQVVIG